MAFCIMYMHLYHPYQLKREIYRNVHSLYIGVCGIKLLCHVFQTYGSYIIYPLQIVDNIYAQVNKAMLQLKCVKCQTGNYM